MGKMQSLMMHNQNGMMGMPEMGDNMNDDLFGQMGGLDGISQEMIQQQMEQLDQMRINDPEAFNQFMAMMQAQTGINPADLMGGANGQGFGY